MITCQSCGGVDRHRADCLAMRQAASQRRPLPTVEAVLEFERDYPLGDRRRDSQILARFGLSSTRYTQHMLRAVNTREALELDPLTTRAVLDRTADRVRRRLEHRP